jgi:hypothetical protein
VGTDFTNQSVALFLQSPMSWNFHFLETLLNVICSQYTNIVLSGTIKLEEERNLGAWRLGNWVPSSLLIML